MSQPEHYSMSSPPDTRTTERRTLDYAIELEDLAMARRREADRLMAIVRETRAEADRIQEKAAAMRSGIREH